MHLQLYNTSGLQSDIVDLSENQGYQQIKDSTGMKLGISLFYTVGVSSSATLLY